MPLPAQISRLTSFTAYQQGQGDNATPGTQLDTEFDQTNNALDALIAAISLVIRADGKLANGSVPRSALGADIMLGLGAARPWSSTVAYVVDDTVTRGYGLYIAIAANTGLDPALTPAAWALQADISQAVIIGDGTITTPKLVDGSVTEPKLASGSASTRVIAEGSVTRSKAALNLGVVPVGGEMDYAGFAPPAGWQLCTGQAVSRATYAALLAAIAPTITADTAIGSMTLSNAGAFYGLGLRGAIVEGPGIPVGTTLTADASGAVAMSAAATANGTQVTLRLFPYGAGNGTTTFNLPDRRGRVTAGRDDMGGTAAGRLVTPFDGATLSGIGGAVSYALANVNLPASLPGGSVTVSYPPQTYIVHAALVAASSGAGGTPISGLWQGDANAPTSGASPQSFGVTNTNAGGGNAFSLVQPTGVANRIIFVGV